MVELLRIMHKIAAPWTLGAQLKLDHQSLERLHELQWRKLRDLLHLAYERAPFYRRRFIELGAVPEDIRAPEDFARLPLLTRQDVLEHGREMLTLPGAGLRQGRSGGTTAAPLAFFYHHDYKYYRLALRRRFDRWIGADGLRPACLLWGEPIGGNIPSPIRSWHRLLQSSFRYRLESLSAERMAALAGDLRLIRPRLIVGYASILLALARRLKEDGLKGVQPPRLVVSTAEMLYPESRAVIEEAFGAPVYNLYGATETHYFAAECPERQGMHTTIDHVYLEILAGDRAAKTGEPGYLVVTDLDNTAMPFIRYNLNDIGAWAAGSCACGRTLPLLKVMGRHSEFVYDCEGTIYTGEVLHCILAPVIQTGRSRQCQLRQTNSGDLQVAVVPGSPGASGLEEEILRLLSEVFRDRMKIGIALVEEIPAESSGKTPFIKSAANLEQIGTPGKG